MRPTRIPRLIAAMGGVLFALLFTLSAAPAVYADCPEFPYTVPAGDSAALVDAVHCANAAPTNDEITLSPGTYEFTSYISPTFSALPPFQSAATAGTLTINGSGALLLRNDATAFYEFRFLYLNPDANVTINHLTLEGGRQVGAGAVYNNHGALVLNDVTLIRNNSSHGGGAIINQTGGVLTLNRSLIVSNTANYGGGIFNSNGTLNIVNSTITGNTSTSINPNSGGGGALDAYGANSTVQIVNSTVVNNAGALAERSGIWLEAGVLTIQNSLVANNNGAGNCFVSGGTFIDAGGNLDNGSSCGFGGPVGHDTDPLLAGLNDNGGATMTHSLLPGSPALNAGVNALAVMPGTGAALDTDQRGAGYPRILNETVDIGAVEVNITPPAAPTLLAPTGSVSDGLPVFQWTPVDGATQYELTVNQLDGAWGATVMALANACVENTCSAQFFEPLEAGIYEWYVTAHNDGGASEPSATWSFTVPLPPAAPLLIAPSGALDAAPTEFTWNPARGAYWYYVWVAGAGGTVFDRWYNAYDICTPALCTLPTPNDITLPPGQHTWWVQAWNPYGYPNGYGMWSSGLMFTVPGATRPTLIAPVGMIQAQQPMFQWTRVGGATWYQIWVINADGTYYNQWLEAAGLCIGNICQINPVSIPYGWHQWWAQAWGPTIGYTEWSDGAIFSLPTRAPIQVSPTGTIATATPEFVWGELNEASWYYVWLTDANGNSYSQWFTSAICGADGMCRVTFPGVTLSNGSYRWWAQAWSEHGDYSAWSPEMTFTVAVPFPQGEASDRAPELPLLEPALPE